MTATDDRPATLADDEIETRRLATASPDLQAADDTGDPSDTSDTGDDSGDDSGDSGDSGDSSDTGDDSGSAA
jgi:hypothetical protein